MGESADMGDGPTIFDTVRDARCAKDMTQSRLAELAGCRQSAISMFEGGRMDALSQKTLAVIAGQLGLDPKSLSVLDQRGVSARSLRLKYCPVAECPSNIPYTVRGKVRFVPVMVEAPASEPTHCSFCGDVLEDACPNAECRAELDAGAFCSRCGTAYVTPAVEREDPDSWSAGARATILEVRGMSATKRFIRRHSTTASQNADNDHQKHGGTSHVEKHQ